ncbi:TPA: hypothetical protein SMP78_001622 [Proteus mirabilis]
MIIDKKVFEPGVSFSNKTHYIPKKENYTYAKKINKIKNTPVAPSFGKKIIQALISLFHKFEIKFLIKDIRNNELSDIVDINKHDYLFNEIDIETNEIDIKINEIKKEIKYISDENKHLYGSFGVDSDCEDRFSLDEINKKEMEIESLIKEKGEIKNKNLNTINNIISHANDKFDFYSLCDYLTEVKRAKDFLSSVNDEGNEYSKNKLIVSLLNEIITNRLNAIDDKSIKNIFKLINLRFNFENIHLNKKYDFMHNFSSKREREYFIKSINFLLISIDERKVLNKFDNNIKNEVENKLLTIMKIALDKNSDSEYSFDSLKQEWGEKYISNNYNDIKINNIIDADIQEETDVENEIEIETIIELPKLSSRKDFNDKYINIDNFDIGNDKLKLRDEIDSTKIRDKIDSTKVRDEYDNLELQWDDEFININSIVENKEQQGKDDKKEKTNDILMDKINKLSQMLVSDDKFNKINDTLDSLMLEIDEYSVEEVSLSNLDKKLNFLQDNYQLDFDTKENTSEISKEDKGKKKL